MSQPQPPGYAHVDQPAAIRRVLEDADWSPHQITAALKRWQNINDALGKKRTKRRRNGEDEASVWRDYDQARLDGLIRIAGEELAYRIVYAFRADQPDDRRYRPAHVDPVLRGVARATGETARAVKARRTIRRADHRDIT